MSDGKAQLRDHPRQRQARHHHRDRRRRRRPQLADDERAARRRPREHEGEGLVLDLLGHRRRRRQRRHERHQEAEVELAHVVEQAAAPMACDRQSGRRTRAAARTAPPPARPCARAAGAATTCARRCATPRQARSPPRSRRRLRQVLEHRGHVVVGRRERADVDARRSAPPRGSPGTGDRARACRRRSPSPRRCTRDDVLLRPPASRRARAACRTRRAPCADGRR